MDYIVRFLKLLEAAMPGETFLFNSAGKVVLGRTGKVIVMEWAAEDVDEDSPLDPLGSAEEFEQVLVATYKRAVEAMK